MSLSNEERNVLVALELKKARETYDEIEILVTANRLNGAANRMYYAVFHAVSALMIHNAISIHTHRGALNAFNKEFVRTGVFSIEEGHLFSKLEGLRERGDYNCFVDATEEEIVPLIEPLKALVEKIKGLL